MKFWDSVTKSLELKIGRQMFWLRLFAFWVTKFNFPDKLIRNVPQTTGFEWKTNFASDNRFWPASKWPVNDRKYVFHFRPKPKPEKHLVLGRIPKPKPKPKVQRYVKIGGILLKFNVSNDLSKQVPVLLTAKPLKTS